VDGLGGESGSGRRSPTERVGKVRRKKPLRRRRRPGDDGAVKFVIRAVPFHQGVQPLDDAGMAPVTAHMINSSSCCAQKGGIFSLP